MYVRDFKPGDRISILVNKDNMMEDFGSTRGYSQNPCYVVINKPDVVILGWKLGDIIPVSRSTSFFKDNRYSQYEHLFEATPNRYTPGLYIVDGPCRQCSKTCTSTDVKCWWCQVSFPTELQRKGP